MVFCYNLTFLKGQKKNCISDPDIDRSRDESDQYQPSVFRYELLEIPVDEGLVYTGYTDEIPVWLQPYLAAAVRSGLTAGLSNPEAFSAGEVITTAEAAVMVANGLDLTEVFSGDA